VFGIIGGLDTGILCLLAFVYGLLEEYGWRGYLQYELRELPVWQYVLIITVMWFLWHLDLGHRNMLGFFPLLLFASWGIGKVASDTHSLLFCAAFHGIVNFSKRGLLSDTTYLVAFICVIIFWIVIWYSRHLQHTKEGLHQREHQERIAHRQPVAEEQIKQYAINCFP
jgi:membrane protease YdiL (CAAX protease family)